MRIIGIGGVWGHQSSLWKNIASAFRERFDGAEFVVEEDWGCHPWEIARLKRFGESIVQKYDDGEEAFLVGHSMGGVIACAIAHRFCRARILGIVTIFSPHNFWTGEYTRALGAHTVVAPIVSFSADYDEVVWWGARHPKAVAHLSLPSNHLKDLLHDPRLAHRIAHETKRWLFPKT